MRVFEGPLSYKTLMETYLSLCYNHEHPIWMRCGSDTIKKIGNLLNCVDPYRIQFEDAVFLLDPRVPEGEVHFIVVGGVLKLTDG